MSVERERCIVCGVCVLRYDSQMRGREREGEREKGEEEEELRLLELLREPVKTLVETITGGGACRLDVPLAATHVVQTQCVGELSCCHCVGQILKDTDTHAGTISRRHLSVLLLLFLYLFVCKHEQSSVTQLVLVHHLMQFILSLNNTLAIVAVDNKDKSLRVLEVVAPQRSDLVLPTDIPHRKADVLVLDSLHVESYYYYE